MATLEENKEVLRKLVKLMDELLDSDDWNKGIYLQTVSGKIKELRQEIQDLVNEISGKPAAGAIGAVQTVQNLISVYVSLYQSDANNVLMWQKTVRRIGEFSLTRPIYRTEEHIQQMIRSRPDPTKEGYAIVNISSNDIIKPYTGKQSADRFGVELLTIREGAIKPENVTKFVHGNKLYRYENGALSLELANH